MTTPAASMQAMQDPTMTKDFAMSSPQRTPRRVLGELTPNAQLTPKLLHGFANSPVKTTPRQSPLKAQIELPPTALLSVDTTRHQTFTSASKKRPFSTIDSPEARLDSARSPTRRALSMEARTICPSALIFTQLPSQIIITQPDQDSDSGSSTDDEDLVAQHGIENDHIELPITHATGGSFSEYFDYDQAKASDDSDRVTVCSPPPAPVTSRVEMLKLRLRMAMYRINTNQTHVPLEELRGPRGGRISLDEESEEEDEEELARGLLVGTEASPQRPDLESPLRARAPQHASHNIVITKGPISKLTQGPALFPTAFSTRFIESQDEPASPLTSSSEFKARCSFAEVMTPVASPRRLHGLEEKDLTSSVVKGHAASGLLELMHAK